MRRCLRRERGGCRPESERRRQAAELYDKAIADLTESIRLNCGNADAFYNRALAHVGKHDRDKAIRDWTEVLRLNPKHVAAYTSRALASLDANKLEDALADCNKAIELAPNTGQPFWIRRPHSPKPGTDGGRRDGLRPGEKTGIQPARIDQEQRRRMQRATSTGARAASLDSIEPEKSRRRVSRTSIQLFRDSAVEDDDVGLEVEAPSDPR